MTFPGVPHKQGLYDPAFERDACGVGFVANIRGEKSHDVVAKGLRVLLNLEHRGACGCDPETGDGAGLLVQIPDAPAAARGGARGIELPAPDRYAVGMVFLAQDPAAAARQAAIFERIVEREGQAPARLARRSPRPECDRPPGARRAAAHPAGLRAAAAPRPRMPTPSSASST